MKVLQINTVCGILSTGRICTDLAEVLESQGHECKIAYGRMTVPEKYQKYAIKLGNSFTNKIDAGFSRIFDNSGLNSKLPTLFLIKKIKAFAPDVIHLHNLHGSYINIKILFKFLKKYNKPVVWTLHDCWTYTGHCAHFTLIGCEKWKTQCYNCPRTRSYPKSLFLDRSRRNHNLKRKLFTSLDNMIFITPSQWLADVSKMSFLGKYEIMPIPNGVDLDIFKPTEGDFRKRYGLEDKKIILGVASAWSESKGINEFAELGRTLGEEYKVVMVGVNDAMAEKLPSEILTIPRTHSVEELAEIYTAADVFLNPSRQETMGLTTVEAMACGTPVVTSNCTAVPEVVDENSGIVCENLEIDTIKSAILTVLSRDYPNTRARAEEYEKVQQYHKYLKVYERIFNKTEKE
ncbi:MAG: glycosyltransferase [Acutalibacteraceae bacterium]|nr:glycosyltransferase [Acutalibacteraceae bacterium]